MSRYLSAEKRDADDFGVLFTKLEGEIVYDACTTRGPWACMTETSFRSHAMGILGRGLGQKYRRDAAGKLVKIEG